MTYDLKAARERWLRGGTGPAESYWIDDAGCRLADAYCALFDETPLTDEWVAEQCYKYGLYFDLHEHEDGYWAIAGPCEKLQLRTRGQFRRCLLAMGVKDGQH